MMLASTSLWTTVTSTSASLSMCSSVVIGDAFLPLPAAMGVDEGQLENQPVPESSALDVDIEIIIESTNEFDNRFERTS